jgi:hypothetical protein
MKMYFQLSQLLVFDLIQFLISQKLIKIYQKAKNKHPSVMIKKYKQFL